jgi:hypothetical protein
MTNILELDVASYATAVGHAAAVRLAQVLGPDFDPNFWFCDPGYAHEIASEGEAKVSALGAYVVERTDRGGVVRAEQLYIKAAELGVHRYEFFKFENVPLWVRVAYDAFANVTALCARELGQAQLAARDEEVKLRAEVKPDPMFINPPSNEAAKMNIDETQLPDAGAPVTGDDAGSLPPDAEPAPPVAEGVDAPSATTSVDVEVMNEHDTAAAVDETKSRAKEPRSKPAKP